MRWMRGDFTGIITSLYYILVLIWSCFSLSLFLLLLQYVSFAFSRSSYIHTSFKNGRAIGEKKNNAVLSVLLYFCCCFYRFLLIEKKTVRKLLKWNNTKTVFIDILEALMFQNQWQNNIFQSLWQWRMFHIFGYFISFCGNYSSFLLWSKIKIIRWNKDST